MMKSVLLILVLTSTPMLAATLNHPLPAGSLVHENDLTRERLDEDLTRYYGQQTRISLFTGDTLNLSVLQSPILIERNSIVPVYYRRGALSVSANARALEPGAIGDRIRLMNQSSHITITGVVAKDGSISVAGEN